MTSATPPYGTYRFSVEDYHRMAEAGILSEDAHVELIEGEIVTMSPLGARHLACVDRLTALLVPGVGPRAIVRVQGSIRLGDRSEPEPDLVLLRPRQDFYAAIPATAGDVLTLIEVMDSSASYDRAIKLGLYARAGSPRSGSSTSTKNGSKSIVARSRVFTQRFRSGRVGRVSRPRRFPTSSSPLIPSWVREADDR